MTFRGDHPDELISASLTGDLTDAERAELDAHLAHCERCRATLAAFKSERRIVSGLPVADPPRDLSARVRSGIESGRFGGPWWRRPGSQVQLLASAAVFAAAVLSVVYFGHLLPAPVGQASGSPVATVSSPPSASAVASTAPSVGPSVGPSGAVTFLAPGQLGYLELSGASLQPSKLSLINDATGASMDLGTASGPPLDASVSPDGQWLAYITRKGETGANEVWALHLADKVVSHLGCSLAAPFTNRLAWSPDSRYLAYTLVGVDLGAEVGCQTPGTGADVWRFDTTVGRPAQFTFAGNTYAADFYPIASDSGPILYVSYADPKPSTALALVDGRVQRNTDIPAGVFLPAFSPDGRHAIFWTGTMRSQGGSWQFSLGGMPHLSGIIGLSGPDTPWVGTPLFSDLTPVGGEAFASGDFAWGPDSNQFAFWDGAWTGLPQSADGTYPGKGDVDVGSVSSLLSTASRVVLDLAEGDWVVDVAIGNSVMAITIGLPSAGIGDPPSAYVQYASLDPHTVGGGSIGDGLKRGVVPPTWTGPAVFGH